MSLNNHANQESAAMSPTLDSPSKTSRPRAATKPVASRLGPRNGIAPPPERSRPSGQGKRLVKASFNLPADELEALRDLAERRNTSATQVVRQALATESYLQRVVDQGGVILAKVGRRAQEIVFSQMQLG